MPESSTEFRQQLDRDIVTGYRENVIAIRLLREGIVWNQRHGLPVLSMTEQIHQLAAVVMRFEDVLDTIPDRRTRNILRCRYALGWTNTDTAIYMNMSRNAVQRIAKDTLDRMS